MEAITIIGAGGIGCAVGYAFCAAGVRVTFVDADEQKVLWGRQPVDGAELNRLRESLDRLQPLPQGSPWLYEIDLRHTDAVVRRTVRPGG